MSVNIYFVSDPGNVGKWNEQESKLRHLQPVEASKDPPTEPQKPKPKSRKELVECAKVRIAALEKVFPLLLLTKM